MSIKTLFASEVSRRIEEVIKVDQTDQQIIRQEIAEYVATDSIKRHYTKILDRYWDSLPPAFHSDGLEVRSQRNWGRRPPDDLLAQLQRDLTPRVVFFRGGPPQSSPAPLL